MSSTLPPTMSENIYMAVELSQYEYLKEILVQGADVNARHFDYNTPLHLAVHKNSKESIKILLENGADVSAKDLHYETPLDIAIGQGSNEIVEILLKYGAEQFLKNFTFIEALKTGSVALVKLFLDNGSNVNTATESEIIPLHYAIECRFQAAADLLLDYGADAKSKDIDNLSVSHKAAIYNASTKLVDRLLENGANLNAKDNYGLTPLTYAVERDNLALIRFILNKNPDLDAKENKLAFCLSLLKEYKSFNNAAAIFVKRGFTLSVEDFNDVFVPTKFLPSLKNKLEDKELRSIIQDSLSKTATSPDEFDKLFLLYEVLKGSIEKGFIDIVNNLLQIYVNVNIPFSDGLTMLHIAVSNGHLPVVEKLLFCGADVNALDKYKMSAYHSSIHQINIKIYAIAARHYTNYEVPEESNQTTGDSFSVNCTKIALLLLNAGANINPENNVEMFQLEFAVQNDLNFLNVLPYYDALIQHQYFMYLFLYRDFLKQDLKCMKLLFNHIDACSSDSSAVLKSKSFNRLSSKLKRLLIKYTAFQESSIDYDASKTKWYDFQKKCQEEIKRIKLTKIEGFSVLVYDVLRKTSRQISCYLKNENFAQVLEQMDLKKTFPLYGNKIKAHVKKGEMTKRLLELSSVYLEDVLNLNFPVLVKDKVLSYFNDQELRRLIFLSPIDEAKKASIQYKHEDEDNNEEDYDDEDDEDVGDFDRNDIRDDYDGDSSDSDENYDNDLFW